ncbi:MAG: immunoglobulin domain-containing protein, partial [Bacteroidota bacterium]
MQKQTRANRLRINEPMRVALATLFFLFLLASASAQIIWQEDFSYPDGMAAGPGWAANAPGQCDANVGQWGVYGGQFVGNDIEGFNCCPCAGGPPNNCGDNNNVIQFGPFDISNFCDVSLNFTFGASGSMECIGGGCPGMPPIGCVGNGHDQAVFNYSIDGGPPVEFGFYCGNFLCSGGPSVTGINGNTFSFTIAMGNQAVSETYFFDDMILQGNQRPMPIPNYNPPLCTGQTLQLTETSGAGTSWQWAGPNGFSSSMQNPSIPNVSALNAGTYTVTVSNGPGCTGVQTVDVIIGSGAMVSLGPDQSVCQNDPPIILNAGPGFSSYAWSPAGSGQSVMISTATPLPTTQYSVTVTDASGCTGTSSVFVTIDPTPDIVNPGNQQSCGIYTLPPITGTNLSGSQSYYLGPGGTGISFPPGSAVISTQTFFIYDANGNCTDEESFTVTISPGPDIINPGNQQACGSYILPPITGSNLTGNQSYYDGPGGTGNAYLPGTPITMTTVLFIYDSAGTCFDEESFTVTINPTPVINNPGNQQACDSYLLPPITGTNLSGTATYYDGPGGTGTAYFPGTSITTSTLLFIYDANGSCIAEESFSVTINPSPDVNNPGSFIGCGTYLLPPITGTNLSGSEAYYDGPGGTGTAYFPGTIISNSITLFVYDAVGTCSDEEFFTITLNPTPSLNNPGNQEVCDSYLLPAISGMNLSGSEAYYDSPGGTGTQFLPGTIINTTSTIFLYDANGSCFDEAVFTVTVNATPDITNPGDQTVCGSYTLPPIAGVGLTGNQGYFDNIGGTGRTYFPGDMITSTTVLYLYDANGSCFDEEVFAITITPAPVITNPGDQTVCDSYTLPTISGTDLTGNQGYFDAPNGGGTAYNAGDNITATTTLYIYDAAGACSDEETFTVTIAPTPIVNNPGNQNVCDSYTLPAITGTNLSGSQGYFDAPNGGGTAYNAGDNITATTTLYIYDAAGACSDEET